MKMYGRPVWEIGVGIADVSMSTNKGSAVIANLASVGAALAVRKMSGWAPFVAPVAAYIGGRLLGNAIFRPTRKEETVGIKRKIAEGIVEQVEADARVQSNKPVNQFYGFPEQGLAKAQRRDFGSGWKGNREDYVSYTEPGLIKAIKIASSASLFTAGVLSKDVDFNTTLYKLFGKAAPIVRYTPAAIWMGSSALNIFTREDRKKGLLNFGVSFASWEVSKRVVEKLSKPLGTFLQHKGVPGLLGHGAAILGTMLGQKAFNYFYNKDSKKINDSDSIPLSKSPKYISLIHVSSRDKTGEKILKEGLDPQKAKKSYSAIFNRGKVVYATEEKWFKSQLGQDYEDSGLSGLGIPGKGGVYRFTASTNEFLVGHGGGLFSPYIKESWERYQKRDKKPNLIEILVDKKISPERIQYLGRMTLKGRIESNQPVNPQDGFPEQGLASSLRKRNTDFGSGWRGIEEKKKNNKLEFLGFSSFSALGLSIGLYGGIWNKQKDISNKYPRLAKMRKAAKHGIMLILDEDTSLPPNFSEFTDLQKFNWRFQREWKQIARKVVFGDLQIVGDKNLIPIDYEGLIYNHSAWKRTLFPKNAYVTGGDSVLGVEKLATWKYFQEQGIGHLHPNTIDARDFFYEKEGVFGVTEKGKDFIASAGGPSGLVIKKDPSAKSMGVWLDVGKMPEEEFSRMVEFPRNFIIQKKLDIQEEFRVITVGDMAVDVTYRFGSPKVREFGKRVLNKASQKESIGPKIDATNPFEIIQPVLDKKLKSRIEHFTEGVASKLPDEIAGFDIALLKNGEFKVIEFQKRFGNISIPIANRRIAYALSGKIGLKGGVSLGIASLVLGTAFYGLSRILGLTKKDRVESNKPINPQDGFPEKGLAKQQRRDFGSGWKGLGVGFSGTSIGYLLGGKKGAIIGGLAGFGAGTILDRLGRPERNEQDTTLRKFIRYSSTLAALDLASEFGTSAFVKGGLLYKPIIGLSNTIFGEGKLANIYQKTLGQNINAPTGLLFNISDALRNKAFKPLDPLFSNPSLIKLLSESRGIENVSKVKLFGTFFKNYAKGLPITLGLAGIGVLLSQLNKKNKPVNPIKGHDQGRWGREQTFASGDFQPGSSWKGIWQAISKTKAGIGNVFEALGNRFLRGGAPKALEEMFSVSLGSKKQARRLLRTGSEEDIFKEAGRWFTKTGGKFIKSSNGYTTSWKLEGLSTDSPKMFQQIKLPRSPKTSFQRLILMHEFTEAHAGIKFLAKKEWKAFSLASSKEKINIIKRMYGTVENAGKVWEGNKLWGSHIGKSPVDVELFFAKRAKILDQAVRFRLNSTNLTVNFSTREYKRRLELFSQGKINSLESQKNKEIFNRELQYGQDIKTKFLKDKQIRKLLSKSEFGVGLKMNYALNPFKVHTPTYGREITEIAIGSDFKSGKSWLGIKKLINPIVGALLKNTKTLAGLTPQFAAKFVSDVPKVIGKAGNVEVKLVRSAEELTKIEKQFGLSEKGKHFWGAGSGFTISVNKAGNRISLQQAANQSLEDTKYIIYQPHPETLKAIGQWKDSSGIKFIQTQVHEQSEVFSMTFSKSPLYKGGKYYDEAYAKLYGHASEQVLRAEGYFMGRLGLDPTSFHGKAMASTKAIAEGQVSEATRQTIISNTEKQLRVGQYQGLLVRRKRLELIKAANGLPFKMNANRKLSNGVQTPERERAF